MEHFDFSIREETRKAIEEMGYETPTPIQEMTIPALLEGKDVIGQAQTGTGKTAAFGIPMIEHVDADDRTVQALVLCPTRELAMQTAGEIAKLAKYRPGLRVLAVYGGQPIERQLYPLKVGVQVVVGTPGRVLDHINRGTLVLSGVKYAVLDEADEMLDMGFRDDIETILSNTPAERQTALFSATMPFPIMSLAQKYLKEPAFLRVENKQLTVEAVKQTYIPIRAFHKVELLARLLVRDNITRALVFMNTKLGVEEVVTKLQARGFAAAGLHGDMRQIERDAIMQRFKNGTVGILIATDVAARGLDIENVEAVFNYDIPLDVEYYVHRIGRTGRAGREGRAYTFVVGRETARMWEYRKVTKAAILCEQPPSGDDIRQAEDARLLDTVREACTQEPEERLTNAAKALLETLPAETAVAALIKMLETAEGEKIEPALDIRIPEPPKPAPVQREVRPLIARNPGSHVRFGNGDRPSRDHSGRFAGNARGGAPAPRSRYNGAHGSAAGNGTVVHTDAAEGERAPKNRFERRRREFGELPEETAAKNENTAMQNRSDRRREFSENSDGASAHSRSDKRREGAEAGSAKDALSHKPYRPWENPSRDHRKRDGAINAKDSLPKNSRRKPDKD